MNIGIAHSQPEGAALLSRRPNGPMTTQLVAIGAAAGGPPAVAGLLRALPADFPAAIVIVQHGDAQFALSMAAWLSEVSNLPVRVAANGDQIVAGTVLLAGRNDHLTFTAHDRLGYVREPHEALCRPSIDVFFHSVVRYWHGHAVGVLLSGMGRDGVAGLEAMHRRGLATIAQNEAIDVGINAGGTVSAGAATKGVLPIEQVATRLARAIEPRTLVVQRHL